ncbi:MAG TPA: hypothetical protein VI759_09225 [Dehalococcoidia bacterium]|nr:hypothetical protein [Dehalococcoidia bacterium]
MGAIVTGAVAVIVLATIVLSCAWALSRPRHYGVSRAARGQRTLIPPPSSIKLDGKRARDPTYELDTQLRREFLRQLLPPWFRP